MRSSFFAVIALAFVECVALVGCGGSDEHAVVATQDPGVRVRRVATKWLLDVTDQGALDRDPNLVLTYRVHTRATLVLGQGAAATQAVHRDESFRMANGADFKCKVEGKRNAEVTFEPRESTVRVVVKLLEAELPRSCDKPGFPVKNKVLGREETVYILQSDRLVPIAPATARDPLLPTD
jgi:hypothetical protein